MIRYGLRQLSFPRDQDGKSIVLGDPQFGKQIGSNGPQWVFLCWGILFALVSLGGMLFGLSLGKVYVAVVVLIACPVPIVFGLYYAWMATKRQRLFERGVKVGSHSLLFDEIDHFTYFSVEEYVNHIYTYSTTTLKFFPKESSDKPKLKVIWGAFFKSRTGVERFLDCISQYMAARQSEQLNNDGKLAWANGISFVDEGLQYENRSNVTQVARYEDLEVKQTKGLMGNRITIKDRKTRTTVGKLNASTPNFFAYMILLEELRNRNVATAVAP